jgi:hypothetical protein
MKGLKGVCRPGSNGQLKGPRILCNMFSASIYELCVQHASLLEGFMTALSVEA